jgi:hypothetical protein
MSLNRVLGRVASAAALTAAAAVSVASPAEACCIGNPPDSPDAFVGTVIDLSSHRRIATVRTEGGDEVQVWGAGTKEPNAFTTVDRRYWLGATYEFHPTNGDDPYQDNACTATHRLRGEAIPESLRDAPATGTGGAVADPADPADASRASATPAGSSAFALGAAVAVVGASGAVLGLRVRRRRS